LFWKGDEANLFLGASKTDYHFSSIEYPIVILGEYFHVVPPPEDERASVIVMRVTPSTIERYVVDVGEGTLGSPAYLTPIDDVFYGMCQRGVLCKWTGNRFVSATDEEQRRLDGVNLLIRGETNNHIVNGWNEHFAPRLPGDQFEFPIGNVQISVKNRATNVRAYPNVSIDLLRPDQAPENIYTVDETPRRVSKSGYQRAFG
jgi:hypothetical protein